MEDFRKSTFSCRFIVGLGRCYHLSDGFHLSLMVFQSQAACQGELCVHYYLLLVVGFISLGRPARPLTGTLVDHLTRESVEILILLTYI